MLLSRFDSTGKKVSVRSQNYGRVGGIDELVPIPTLQGLEPSFAFKIVHKLRKQPLVGA